MGSSHTFFHACYLKWDYLPVFIKIPTTENSKLLSSWYSLVPPNNFSHGHYNDSKIFFSHQMMDLKTIPDRIMSLIVNNFHHRGRLSTYDKASVNK